jgi:hypothetical protein
MSKRAIITTPFPSVEETAGTKGVPRSDTKWLVALEERLIPAGDASPSGSGRDNGTHARNKGESSWRTPFDKKWPQVDGPIPERHFSTFRTTLSSLICLTEIRSNVRLNAPLENFLRGRFQVGVRVFQEIVEEFSAGGGAAGRWRQFTASLPAEDLIAELFGFLNVCGSRRAHLLLAVHEVGHVPDAPALKNCASSVVCLPYAATIGPNG